MVLGQGRALTKSGAYQVLRRRVTCAGVGHVRPHRLRHGFSHRYLDNGDAEGDLMGLNGWDSRQVLRHYDQAMERCA